MPYISRRLDFDKVNNDESSESESELLQLQSNLFLQRRTKVSITTSSLSSSSSTSSLESDSILPVKQKASDIFKPRYSISKTTIGGFKVKLNENTKPPSSSTPKDDQKQIKTIVIKKETIKVAVDLRRSTRVRKPVKRLGINN